MKTDHQSCHHRHVILLLAITVMVVVVHGIVMSALLSVSSAYMPDEKNTPARPDHLVLQVQILTDINHTNPNNSQHTPASHTPTTASIAAAATPAVKTAKHNPTNSTPINTHHTNDNGNNNGDSTGNTDNAHDLADSKTDDSSTSSGASTPAPTPTTTNNQPSAELRQATKSAANRITNTWGTLINQTIHANMDHHADFGDKKLIMTVHLDDMGNVIDIKIGKGDQELADSAIAAIRQSSPLSEMAGIGNKLTFILGGFMLTQSTTP